MSVTRQPRSAPPPPERVAPAVRDMSPRRMRGRESRRRKRLLRLDLGLGLLGAIVLLLATPGLAVAALLALILIAVCVGSVLLERRRSRRR